MVTEEEYDQNPPRKQTEISKIFTTSNNTAITTTSTTTITTSNKLYIITYNVKTLSTYERLIELNESLSDIKYDIIGLAETRRMGNKIQEYDDFIFCHTGQTPGLYGVGFMDSIS